MAYNPEKTILALAKRELRIPLTQRETGMVMGLLMGRTRPVAQQSVREIEQRALRKLRAAVSTALDLDEVGGTGSFSAEANR